MLAVAASEAKNSQGHLQKPAKCGGTGYRRRVTTQMRIPFTTANEFL